MTSRPSASAVDVLLVSLGSTFGLRAADDQLAATLRESGLSVEVARPAQLRSVPTLMLTDLVQALACRAVAREALRRLNPRVVLYSTTTAALLWPRRGAVRFDALAAVTRPGRHGLWQRPLERRRLRQATMLLPLDSGSLEGIAPGHAPALIVPPALEPPTQPAAALDAEVGDLLAAGGEGTQVVAVTYAADASKKGLDRVLDAWAVARRPGEVLAVAGRDDLPAGHPRDGVVLVGRLPRDLFRAFVRGAGTFVTAPRREDYGLVQLEALAEGARVVTTAAPGPYAALPLVRELWPEQVCSPSPTPQELAAAMRWAIDAAPDPVEQLRATTAVRPWAREAVLARVTDEVVPTLLGVAPPAATPHQER